MHIRCHGNCCSRLKQGPYERGNYSLVTDKEKKVKAKPCERERQECSKWTGKATKAFTSGRGHFSTWLWIQVLICHQQSLAGCPSKAAGRSPSVEQTCRDGARGLGAVPALCGLGEKSLASAFFFSTKSIIKACFWKENENQSSCPGAPNLVEDSGISVPPMGRSGATKDDPQWGRMKLGNI